MVHRVKSVVTRFEEAVLYKRFGFQAGERSPKEMTQKALHTMELRFTALKNGVASGKT